MVALGGLLFEVDRKANRLSVMAAEYHHQIEGLNASTLSYKNQIDGLNAEIANDKRHIGNLSAEIASYKNHVDGLNARLSAYNAAIETYKGQIDTLYEQRGRSFAPGDQYFVAPNGSDQNDCLTPDTPCETIQVVVDKIPSGGSGNIILARGRYPNTRVNATWHRVITINGDCDDPSAVVLTGSGPIVRAQDQIILGLQCFTMEAPGGIGIAARQFAIVDFYRIRFGAMHIALSIQEMSKANCLGRIEVFGDQTNFLHVADGSSAYVNCSMKLMGARHFNIFATAAWNARIFASAATIGWEIAPTGIKYQANGSTIFTPPGNGFPGDQPGTADKSSTVH
jgi:hypothetical protein